jgi:hypothetical protein
MLNNFFRINMPYGIIRNKKGEWTPFNREYLPLGFNDYKYKDRLPESLDGYPIWTEYKSLDEKTLLALAWSESGVNRDEAGKISQVWFYNDASNPSSNDIKTHWDAYFERIKRLSKFSKK